MNDDLVDRVWSVAEHARGHHLEIAIILDADQGRRFAEKIVGMAPPLLGKAPEIAGKPLTPERLLLLLQETECRFAGQIIMVHT